MVLYYLAECRRHEVTIEEMRDTIDRHEDTIEELRSTIDNLRRHHIATIEELSSTVEGLQMCQEQLNLEIEMANRRRQGAIRRRLTNGYFSRAEARRYRNSVRLREAAAYLGL